MRLLFAALSDEAARLCTQGNRTLRKADSCVTEYGILHGNNSIARLCLQPRQAQTRRRQANSVHFAYSLSCHEKKYAKPSLLKKSTIENARRIIYNTSYHGSKNVKNRIKPNRKNAYYNAGYNNPHELKSSRAKTFLRRPKKNGHPCPRTQQLYSHSASRRVSASDDGLFFFLLKEARLGRGVPWGVGERWKGDRADPLRGAHSSISDWAGESRLCFAFRPKQANILNTFPF